MICSIPREDKKESRTRAPPRHAELVGAALAFPTALLLFQDLGLPTWWFSQQAPHSTMLLRCTPLS